MQNYECGMLNGYSAFFFFVLRRKVSHNITEADFCLIPMIIDAADDITQGKYPDTVVYRKTLEKEYYYVEIMWNVPVQEGKGWP